MKPYLGLEKFSAIIMDDLAVTTLLKCDAFQHKQYADLALPRYGVSWIDFETEGHHPGNAVARTHGAPVNRQRTESVGQQIDRLQRLHKIQGDFHKLMKATYAAINGISSDLDREKIANDFIEASHDYLSRTDDPDAHNFIMETANETLSQIDPLSRKITTLTVFRFQKLVKDALASIKKATDALEIKLIVDHFIVGCHEYLAGTDDPNDQRAIVEKAGEVLDQIDPSYRSHSAFNVNRLRLNNS